MLCSAAPSGRLFYTPQGLLTTLSSLLSKSQARLHAKSSGDCRKHGDDELNDFAPNGRFVSFHRVRLVSSEERGVRSEERGVHTVRASRKAVNRSTLTVPRLQVQSYTPPHPTWHLLAFSIAKMGENMRLTNRHSVFYKR